MNTHTEHTRVLVTGGTGFLASHTISRLLEHGYDVVTTVRSLDRANDIRGMLEAAGAPRAGEAEVVEADLAADAGWGEAVAGCAYVLHVASPFPTRQPAHEDELITPARDGMIRVLTAAREAGARRVVVVSSFTAIDGAPHEPGHVFTEEDWSDPTGPLVPYVKSKTIAEQAAWDFAATHGGGIEVTVINPVGLFGPALTSDYSPTLGMLKAIMTGATTTSPDYSMGVVDVRDVADILLTAMTHPDAAGERFIAAADNPVTQYDMATIVSAALPEHAGRIAQMTPNDPSVYIALSNAKARRVLGWDPRTREEAIVASAESLIRLGEIE